MPRQPAKGRPGPVPGPGTGLARALSKLGHCSRSQAWDLIERGQVRVNGQRQLNPEHRVFPGRDRIEVEGAKLQEATLVYWMLNKPRGLVNIQ